MGKKATAASPLMLDEGSDVSQILLRIFFSPVSFMSSEDDFRQILKKNLEMIMRL